MQKVDLQFYGDRFPVVQTLRSMFVGTLGFIHFLLHSLQIPLATVFNISKR